MTDPNTDLPHPDQSKPFDMRPGAVNRITPEHPELVITDKAEPDAKEPAAARLRAFEDHHFGKKAVRIRGQIEKGYGSPFKEMSPEKHAEYAALEKLVEAEAKVDAANVALSKARNDHDAALEALALATKASEKAAADAKKLAEEEANEAASTPAA